MEYDMLYIVLCECGSAGRIAACNSKGLEQVLSLCLLRACNQQFRELLYILDEACK